MIVGFLEILNFQKVKFLILSLIGINVKQQRLDGLSWECWRANVPFMKNATGIIGVCDTVLVSTLGHVTDLQFI